MALFRWVDIVDILEIRTSMITTFVLLLSVDMSQKASISTFKIDANKKILNVMKTNCKNEKMLSKIMNLILDINQKY